MIILIKITHRPNRSAVISYYYRRDNNNNLNRSGDRRSKVVGGCGTTPERISPKQTPGGWPACLGYIYIIYNIILLVRFRFFSLSRTHTHTHTHDTRHGSRGSRDRQGRPGKIVFTYYYFFFSLYILCNTNEQI